MAGYPRSLGSEHNGKPAVLSRWSQTGTSLKRLLWWRMAPARAEVKPGDCKRVQAGRNLGALEEALGAEGGLWSCCCAFWARGPQPTSSRRLTTPPCRMRGSSPNCRQASQSQAGLAPVLLCRGKPGSLGQVLCSQSLVSATLLPPPHPPRVLLR